MRIKSIATIVLFLIVSGTLLNSCKNLTGESDDISDSLDPVENVVPVEGAENATITVNKSSDYYFSIGFTDLAENTVIQDGFTGEGWCIDWQKPIDSDNGTYSGIQLYSTFNVEKWNPLNFLLNITDDLREADPELTFREIQAAVWSLRGFPEFNLEAIPDEELPSRLRGDEGEANFSREKVATILEIVEGGYENFNFTEGTRYAVIAETPADVQTVITVVE